MPRWKPSQIAPRVRESAAAVRRALRELVALGVARQVGEAFTRVPSKGGHRLPPMSALARRVAEQLRAPLPKAPPFSKRRYRQPGDNGAWYRRKPKWMEEHRG